ncbi:MAG TPA: hypothetical protein VIZ68_02815 [Thermoplasmata archaeon]
MVEVEEISKYLDASAWLGVGVLGILLFAVGVYTPALGSLPGAAWIQGIVAIGGGALAVLAFTCYWDRREYERRHPKRRPLTGRALELAIAPSFEVYRPGEAVPGAEPPFALPAPAADEERRP